MTTVYNFDLQLRSCNCGPHILDDPWLSSIFQTDTLKTFLQKTQTHSWKQGIELAASHGFGFFFPGA